MSSAGSFKSDAWLWLAISQPTEQLEISVKHQSVQFYGHQTLSVSLKVIENMVAPVIVETTVVEAVVEAIDINNNDNERGQRRMRVE